VALPHRQLFRESAKAHGLGFHGRFRHVATM
jgi:hypothetical protein